VQSKRLSLLKRGQILGAPGESISAHQRNPFALACFGICVFRGGWGGWQEKHPSDAAAAVTYHSLAAFIAGWVTTLFASALRVSREAQEWAKRQPAPREADVTANSLVPETVLET